MSEASPHLQWLQSLAAQLTTLELTPWTLAGQLTTLELARNLPSLKPQILLKAQRGCKRTEGRQTEPSGGKQKRCML